MNRYADVWTRSELEGKKSKTLCLVKPDAYSQLGKIVQEVRQFADCIPNESVFQLSEQQGA